MTTEVVEDAALSSAAVVERAQFAGGGPFVAYGFTRPEEVPAFAPVGGEVKVTVRGRVVTDKRKTSNKTKVFDYAYNLNGSVQSITYPSGQRVDYSYNAAGRAVSATDVGSGTQLATQALYAPHGAPASLQTGVGGGFAGYSRTWSYNERLQPVTIVAASPTQTLLDLTYDFGLGVANNGNVKLIFNNLNGERTQSFSYDGLNRIETASVPTDWGLSYAYDRYGNLLTRSVTQGSAPALSVAVNSKNRITNAGFSYDAAGNMTADGSGSFAYDAENRMTSAAGVGYTYDGDGRRVKKSNGTLYWYGLSGEVLLETNSAGNNPTEYMFFNGQRMARRDPSGSVFYYFEDHLGSSRAIVQDGQEQPCYEADFYPFGGERVITDTCPQNYKFTGQERDAETGLDYFIARHYASNLGRFIQPDPGGLIAVHLENPQTWNWYAYTLNNPLRYTDPTGMYVADCRKNDQVCEENRDNFEEARQDDLTEILYQAH
jgi:RHS repeat-associated protein